MSAIFGLLRFNGPVSIRDLERAGNALAHRGRDGRKIAVDGAAGLGHCLMRVNREDDYEVQPLRDHEGSVTLVADLRLDNREDLAAIFGIDAARLPVLPDSALLLRAYRQWGSDCVTHLIGDFAFAIWDARKKELILGRDQMGQRYVHYHHGTGFFAFATDVRALWSVPGVPYALRDSQIGRWLMHDRTCQDGETSFEGIRGLPGATVMTIGSDGSARTHRYWEPRADPVHEGRDEAYYVDAYRRVLSEAVACRVRRVTRRPGLVFSGGYDSAAIAGLAKPALAGPGAKLVAAASVMDAGYRGSIRHARPWVEMCARDMPHIEVHYVTREGRSILSDLERTFLEVDGPASPSHFVMTELMSTLAAAGAQLVMDGHGGDYTLHPRGQAALARFLATFQLRRFCSELRGHLRLTGRSLWTTVKKDLASPLLPPSVRNVWRRARRPAWSNSPIDPEFARRLLEEGVVDPEGLPDTGLRIGMRGQMESVLRRVSGIPASAASSRAAWHGLELTRPFHDKRVVELALAIPEDLYVKNGRNRYLACRALQDIYPPEFQTRWRRNDDEIPDFQRMANSIQPQLLAEIERMENSPSVTRYIDFGRIRSLLLSRAADNHNSGWEQETHAAVFGFVIARYVEWFNGNNR